MSFFLCQTSVNIPKVEAAKNDIRVNIAIDEEELINESFVYDENGEAVFAKNMVTNVKEEEKKDSSIIVVENNNQNESIEEEQSELDLGY